MRKEKHDIEELLKLFDQYWEKECLKDPKKLLYTSLARYMQANGYDVDSNYLKHRPAIVERYQAYKKECTGASWPMAATDPEAYRLREKVEIMKGLLKKYFIPSVYNALIEKYENIELNSVIKDDLVDELIITPETTMEDNETTNLLNRFFSEGDGQ